MIDMVHTIEKKQPLENFMSKSVTGWKFILSGAGRLISRKPEQNPTVQPIGKEEVKEEE